MPELPEVETIKQELEQNIIGKKIAKVEVRLPKVINVSKKEFGKRLTGAVIKNVKRRAKVLIIELSNGCSLLIHLKLTGQLIYTESGIENLELRVKKYTHVIFTFSDRSMLLFNDLRQFGYIKIYSAKEICDLPLLKKFGPEPLDKNFTLEIFKKLLSKRRRSKIKPLLMNQNFIAGIGNAYSDEILFYAHVRPERIVKTLTDQEIKKIFDGIKKILPQAIAQKGASVDTYVDIFGEKGKFVPLLKVYGRGGKSCVVCKTKIKELKIGGRTAHFCPKCQK